MKHIYYESKNVEELIKKYKEKKPDIYKTSQRLDLKTLEIIYCLDMWFIE